MMTMCRLAEKLGILIPHGSEFVNGIYFYNAFPGNDIKPLRNGNNNTSYTIGIIVNGKEMRYPINAEDFKKEINDDRWLRQHAI